MENTNESLPAYQVKKTTQASWEVDGRGGNPAWEQANSLTSFSLPWWDETPLPTEFKALWNEERLYFLFTVEDAELNAKVENNEKMEAASSDRIELFFKIDDEMKPYYCLEIDYLGRILDYKADHYREMHYDWEWPDEIRAMPTVTEKGYIVEGWISMSSLKNLGLVKENTIQAGLFRADYTKDKSTGELVVRWITWVNPGTERPDFHVASAFGILTMIE
jgi:hypothetical protein